MGFMLATHFDFSNKGGFKLLLHNNTYRIFDSFWVLICNFMFFVVRTLIGSNSRVHEETDFGCNRLETSIIVAETENLYDSSGYGDSNPNGENELYPVVIKTALIPSNRRYEFLSDKISICGFIEEPKAVSFAIQEHFLCSGITEEPNDQEKTREFPIEQRLERLQGLIESVVSSSVETESEKEEVDWVDSSVSEEMIVYEVISSNKVTDGSLNLVAVNCGNERVGLINGFDVSDDEFIEIQLQNQNWSPLEPVDRSVERSMEREGKRYNIFNDDDESDDEDRLGYDEVQNMNLSVLASENLNEAYDDDELGNDEEQNENLSNLESKQDEYDDEFWDYEAQNKNLSNLESTKDEYDNEFGDYEVQNENLSNLELKQDEYDDDEVVDDDELGHDKVQNVNLSNLELKQDEYDDDDELEHDEVIERLRMELKTARTGGLQTILEESEFPEFLDEVKPMKTDKKLEHKDLMAEIQKVYKNYAHKMRKFDVLNSQTSHSISLLKLKDSSQSCSKDDSSARTRKTRTGQNLWPFKQKRIKGDQIEKTSRDIHRDFETVYVGQLCLSWEILNWQYMKTLELKQHDAQSVFHYNLVAGEFQLFQVLLQRFTEMEPFQKRSRIENYVKNRIGFHNFLQVPLIKDDRSRGNRSRSTRDYAITVEQLREILFESMVVFWEFLRADKSEILSVLRSHCQARVSPQEPLDLAFLTDIRNDLQKKEKKLKDILRSGTCVVKKLRKSSLDCRVKDELFVARVELQLVSRVLNMSKLTTDHLLWCREKLNKINFSSRKIHLDHTFSFFPC